MSNTGYKHSELFAKLKHTQETITHNPTSVEYLRTLDMLIENSFLPILESCRFIDTFLAKILAWQSSNPKRKTSAGGKKDLPSYVTLFLITSDPEAKMNIYNKIGFDRGITMEMIRRWIKIMDEYAVKINLPEPTAEDRRAMYKIQHSLDFHEDSFPYGSYLQTKFWFDKSNHFKSLILEKYTRLCLNTAQQDYVRFKFRIEMDDILQVYLMTASKAIDKCDSSKGVLTSHIQNWLLSARNLVAKRYLDNYNDRQPFMTDNQEALDRLIGEETSATVETEALESVEDKLERQGTIDRVRQLAKFFDPTGYGRLLMGVGEYVSPQMSAVLESSAVNKVTPA